MPVTLVSAEAASAVVPIDCRAEGGLGWVSRHSTYVLSAKQILSCKLSCLRFAIAREESKESTGINELHENHHPQILALYIQTVQ